MISKFGFTAAILALCAGSFAWADTGLITAGQEAFQLLQSAEAQRVNFIRETPGCKEATEFHLMLEVYGDRGMLSQMSDVFRRACSGHYSSGATIKYPNGQTATLWAGRDGATWHWPNGQTATSWARREGATWKWPNGETATLWAYRIGASWKYPNGQTITSWAGKSGATYYDRSGNSRGSAPAFVGANGWLDVVPFLKYILSLH